MAQITEHFYTGELACSCCDLLPPAEVLVATAEWLEEVRRVLGDRPMLISSGMRCPAKNARVGGARNSLHMRGLAVDFTTKALSAGQVRQILVPHWPALIPGLGAGRSYTHIDRRATAQERWSYDARGRPVPWRG